MNFHGNKRNASLLLIALSLGAIAYGVYMVLFLHHVDCGGQVMHAGQICRNGLVRKNLTEQHWDNIGGGVAMFVFGGLAGGYAVRNLIALRKTTTTTYPQANSH